MRFFAFCRAFGNSSKNFLLLNEQRLVNNRGSKCGMTGSFRETRRVFYDWSICWWLCHADSGDYV
jgi:hypothetical protein